VRIADLLGGAEVVVQARVVVNAAGPWSDAVRALADARTPAHVLGSKGVHVSVPAERLGNRGAVTLLSPTDGRVMFVLPGGTQSIIGTTETPAERGPDEVRATERDVAYLLASANAFFPAARLTRDDVTAAWAGIRPLAASRTSASRGTLSASREHTIERAPRGLITVTGGKLTTYRAMAAQIVDAVSDALGRRLGAAATDRTPLPGGDGDPAALIALATPATGNPAIATRLVRAHGTAWRAVWDLTAADRSLAEPLIAGRPYVGAEFVYAVRHELAFTLADLLIRRVPLAYETSDHAASIAPRVASLVAPILGWSAEDRARALGSYDAEIRRIFGVDA
jgi:glycerol-3-phosphate dehydrogenase